MKKSEKIKLLEKEIEKLNQENELLRRAAYKDSLTNINNRRILDNYNNYFNA